jgi:hypothetical protein
MELKDADIKKFQGLFLKYFGIELCRDDAYRKLTMLVRQVELTYRNITLEQSAAMNNGNLHDGSSRPKANTKIL